MADFSACANAEPVSRLEQLERENADFRTWGIIEIATRNPNVAEYMTHWEARVKTAEAEVTALRARLETVEADRAAQAERMARMEEALRPFEKFALAAKAYHKLHPYFPLVIKVRTTPWVGASEPDSYDIEATLTLDHFEAASAILRAAEESAG